VPDRYLREALLRSDRFDALSDPAQLLFYRLMSVVDDFGCYDGREYVIATATRPLRAYDITEAIIELHKAGFIVRYANAGKAYIALRQWGEMTRGRRKFPAPPINVDRPGVKYRGPFGRTARWENPKDTDPVSILLDANSRPVVPQPPEWRRVDSDWMPITSGQPHGSHQAASDAAEDREQAQAAVGQPKTGSPPVANDRQLVSVSAVPTVSGSAVPTVDRVVAAGDVEPTAATGQPAGSQALPTTPPPGNGKIKCKSGEWQGLSEAQRLRWQAMFTAISIPDQLDRAAAWLEAHPSEHEEIASADGEHAFIVRWLLREVRPATGSTRAKADA
jgi:hypothetical protein